LSTYTVGGSLSGLASGNSVTLQNNGGDDQALTNDGNFTFAAQDDGTGYAVAVTSQPQDPTQYCSVSNGTGTLSGADVIDVDVSCSTSMLFSDGFEILSELRKTDRPGHPRISQCIGVARRPVGLWKLLELRSNRLRSDLPDGRAAVCG
jgi:hypothetical protein